MSFKSMILAAAAVSITATAGVADTYFDQGSTIESSNVLQLGLITADGAGVVEVYDYHKGEQGRLLGTDNLRAGINSDVRVNTGLPHDEDIIAVVKVGGEVVATKRFDIN